MSIDESLMAYKGRLSWIQYQAFKRARFGVKVYMFSEAKSGYIWNSILYTGKETQWDSKYSHHGVAKLSVLSLADCLLDQGYCITLDNFYTLPELFDILLQRQTDAYGTARANCCNMPDDIGRVKLQCGETAAWQKGKMLAVKWRDKKDISFLSTVHNSSMVTVRLNSGVATYIFLRW